MSAIQGDAIVRFQLVAQRSAVRLEKLGMTRRGRSVTAMLKEKYGMKRNATHDAVIDRITKDIAEIDGEQV